VSADPAGTIPLYALLVRVGFAASNSEARRLIAQRAVRLDNEVVEDALRAVAAGEVLLAVGRRRMARVRVVPPS